MANVDFDRDDLFDFDDHFFSLLALEKTNRTMIAGVRESWKRMRDFCRYYLAPQVLTEDRKNAADHDYISWDLLRLAGRHHQLSSFIPPLMGGTSAGPPAVLGPAMEEQAAVDTGFSGMLGGHGLGLVALMMTFNMRILMEVAEKIVEGEARERPYVIDCAITEPTAGTDVEEVELYPKAKLMSKAARAPGGAVLNGRKCFISTGHMATDHVILMPFDLKDPVNNYGCFLVPGDAKGFSLGRKERKMGHRASAISELIFEDCFVPQEYIVMDTKQFAEDRYRGQFPMLLEMVLGVTRTAVGAMGTGCARGSFERALAWCQREKHKGRTLIHQQWAQAMLTNMFNNVMMARSVYMESTYCLMTNLQGGLARSMPPVMNSEPVKKIIANPRVRKFMQSDWLRKKMLDQMLQTSAEGRRRIQYMSSLAKVVGSDLAMENGHLAVEMLARAGVRHDSGIEKGFRDAKLIQIFEGTNQLNRLNIFKHYLGRRLPGVEVF